MTEDEKMAERLEERGKRTPRIWATSDLYYEAAALIRRRVAEKATLVEAARPFAYLIEGELYPTEREVERLRAAIEEVKHDP